MPRRGTGSGKAAQTARPFVLVLPVIVATAVAAVVSVLTLAFDPHEERLAALAGAAIACALADAFPVWVRRVVGGRVIDTGQLSLGVVFVTSCAVVAGPVEAFVAGAAGAVAGGAFRGRPPIRVAYTAGVYGFSGLAAGLAAAAADAGLPVDVALAAVAFYAVNESLITAVIALTAGERLVPALRNAAASSVPLFAILTSVVFVLVVLWRGHPLYAFALAGPVAAVLLHQRSTSHALQAMRLALSDALTGLGNVRLLDDRFGVLAREAEQKGHPLAICLVDLDDFKSINDTRGHAAGDRALVSVAGVLDREGEAFRIGGDEFALLLPGQREQDALETARRVGAGVREASRFDGVEVHVSIGVAAWPEVGDVEGLRAAADRALYAAKAAGKGTARPSAAGEGSVRLAA